MTMSFYSFYHTFTLMAFAVDADVKKRTNININMLDPFPRTYLGARFYNIHLLYLSNSDTCNQ